MVTRRTFLKISSAGVLTLCVLNKFGVEEAIAAIPGGKLLPTNIPKFVAPLVKPPAMPPSGLNRSQHSRSRQFSRQILPAPLPMTTVWSYGAPSIPATFNYPAFTIEATRGTPVTVASINELKDAANNYLPHLLPVDPTLHWANPAGGASRRVIRCRFSRRRRGHTRVPCRSSHTYTVWSASRTGATAIRKPGIFPRLQTSRQGLRPTVPGKISSKAKLNKPAPASRLLGRRRSGIRIVSGPRRRGTPTTPSG